MEEELSPAAARAVEWAGRFALSRHAGSVTAGDLLAGLLADGESHAGALLRAQGIPLDALLAELGCVPNPPEVSGQLPPLNP